MTIDRGMKRALAVWAVIMSAGILYAGWNVVPSKPVMYTLIVLFLVEIALIVDKFLGNTLSEAMWFLNRRPLVPHLFGVALGWCVGLGWLDPQSLMFGYLGGHFFWQAYTAPTCAKCGGPTQ